ncbi:MAG: hypothetical protein ACP5D7_21675 [Limnospira sp.]
MEPNMEFLTPEEAIKVDAALLSSKEKFSTRLAIYALRCLQQIGKEKNCAIAEIHPEQVVEWIKRDEKIQHQLEIDESFEIFFSRLVISSMKPLNQISKELETSVEDLTVEQVVNWFEKDGKIRREKGNDAAFLDL